MIKNIISKLTFDDIADNTNLPVTYKDNNKYSSLIWNTYSTAKITHSNNVNVLNITSVNIRVASNTFTTDKQFRINDFELDINISFNTLNSNNNFFGITSSGSNWIYFNVRNTFIGGLSIVSSANKSMQFNYKFESNKDYNIIVSSIDNKYRLIINGETIGFIDSSIFISSLPANSNVMSVLGSGNNLTSQTDNMSNGKIWNVNISYGAGVKNEDSTHLTKYGSNLLSRLNFDNIQQATSVNIFTPSLESLINSKVNWEYDNSKLTDYYVNTTFKTNISTDFTLLLLKMSNNRKNIDTKLIEYGNYKVIYNYVGVPEPEVIVTDKTTSALDFEDGIIDQVGTTIWQKEGTADVTSVNKIFGTNSFETKALGDSLYTNSNVITGGSTPFTIEFYCLLIELPSNIWNFLYSKNNNNDNSDYGIFIKNNILSFVESATAKYANKKIYVNDINKYSITYDGVALRIFVNDDLELVIGTPNGFVAYTQPLRFLDYKIPSLTQYNSTTKGIIDNINIYDGIATKVRDPDPYEEFLVADLAFDGENNSTKIVDNGTLKSEWIANSAYLSTDQKFDGFSSLYIGGYITTTCKLDLQRNFTISFEYIRKNVLASAILDYRSSPGAFDGFLLTHPSANINKMNLYFNGNGTDWQVNLRTNSDIEVDKKYKIDIVCSNNTVSIYINNVLDIIQSYNDDVILSGVSSRLLSIGRNVLGGGGNLSAYIKNFKIYKGVAVIPEDPTGKIQLDFDNNLVDKYGNSTWTNNGVTFDQVNSVKGYSAYFDGNSTTTLTSSSASLNMGMNNFVFEYDNYRTLKAPSNLQMYIFANSIAPVGGTGSNIRITKGATTDTTDTTFMTYDTVPANRTYPSNNDYVNTWYNDRFVKKQSTILSYKNDVIYDCINDSTSNFNFISGGSAVFGKRSDWGTSYKGYIDNFKSYKEDLTIMGLKHYKTNSSAYVENESMIIKFNNASGDNSYHSVINEDSPVVKNFVAEIEYNVYPGNTNYNSIVFRTNDYSLNNMDKFGYIAYITGDLIRFGRGSNSSTAGWVKLGQANIPVADGNIHKLKVIANESNFKVYYDGTLMIDVTDNTYTNSSQIGHVFYNFTSIKPNIKSLKITDLNGLEIYYKDFKSKIQNVIDKPAVHLPLETNAINTGFSNLTINSDGNPTYHIVDGKKCIKFENGKSLSITSNNIFNLGSNSDFYIEMNVYMLSIGSSISSYILTDGSTTKFCFLEIRGSNNRIYFGKYDSEYIYCCYSSMPIEFNVWYNLTITRKNNTYELKIKDVNGELLDKHTNTLTKSITFDFSIMNTMLGGTTKFSNTSFDGYMSNFKMFVGTSEIPETYNDKKVLDMDFKPTRKSYLFKDNNNKCVIHPVNITQRDYQDSQYCCTFNGTNQYLQLGKNDLLNFGLDDFVINIKFKLNNYNANQSSFLMNSGELSATNTRLLIGISYNTNNADAYKLHFLTTSGNVTQSLFCDIVNLNTYNDVLIVRKNGLLTINQNGILYNKDFDFAINGNLNNNTYIGTRQHTSSASNSYFNGTIYSIKVLRNTTDLSLLEDELDVFNESFKLTNGDETLDQVITNDKKVESHDVRFIKDEESTKLIVDGEFVEVPNVENTADDLILFDNYNGKVSDIKLYDKSFIDEDIFLGNDPIDTEFGEVEYADDEMELFLPEGEFNLIGFIEGYTDRKFSIYNTFYKYELYEGIEDYNITGLDEYSLDEYEIFDLVSGEKYKVLTHEMIKGFISGTVNLKNCGVTSNNMEVFCYRSDNYRHIGTYSVDKDGKYVIPNLDVNSRYDIIFRDKTKKIKDQISNYRKPMKY